MVRFLGHLLFGRFLIALGILQFVILAGCGINGNIDGGIGSTNGPIPKAQTSYVMSLSSGQIDTTTPQGSVGQYSLGKPVLGGHQQTSGGYQVTFSFQGSAR
jgi:hypothetical protein